MENLPIAEKPKSAERSYARFGNPRGEDAEIFWIHRHSLETLTGALKAGNDCNVALLDEMINALKLVRSRVTFHKVGEAVAS